MDRRQRKTRDAIFKAFTSLLSRKGFEQITVGEIIELADIGRATFYAHFESKDLLLKEFCEELFCHLFDAANKDHCDHKHIFSCDSSDSAFLHFFRHLQKNDNELLTLLSSQNNTLFLRYFKEGTRQLIKKELPSFEAKKAKQLPDSFWIDHITNTFLETIRWWIEGGMRESPELITEYFMLVV